MSYSKHGIGKARVAHRSERAANDDRSPEWAVNQHPGNNNPGSAELKFGVKSQVAELKPVQQEVAGQPAMDQSEAGLKAADVCDLKAQKRARAQATMNSKADLNAADNSEHKEQKRTMIYDIVSGEDEEG